MGTPVTWPLLARMKITDPEVNRKRVFANLVSSNYFQVLGVAAMYGRVFGAGDSEQPGASPIAVLSQRFWLRRFDGDRSVVGRAGLVGHLGERQPHALLRHDGRDQAGEPPLAPELITFR